jgi:hypothetical protein
MDAITKFLNEPLPPCYKQPILTGLAVSTLLFGHHYRLKLKGASTVKRAIDMGTFGFIGTSMVSFYMCQRDRKERSRRVEEAMEKGGIKKS